MTTKFIGVREFRQNMTTLYNEAQRKNLRFIVFNRNTPVFKIEPINKKDATLEKLSQDIKEAREDVEAGRVYDFEEVCKEWGV